MIQDGAIYSGTIQIDNHNLYEDEIRSLVMKELEKNNIILETDFQIVYDVLDSEISFSVFLKNYKDDKLDPKDEIVKKITKLKEEFYSCDSNDFERREILLLEMENILDTYYRSHDIKTKNDNINSDDSVISISELKSRLDQNIRRYNDIDIEISNLKKEQSQKLDSNHGVLSQEEITNIESGYLEKISNLNSESVQCLMHIDLIENVLYNVKEKEKEKEIVDYSILDNIQMVVYPESIRLEGSRKMPLLIKQLVELRLKSKSHPQLVPNNTSFHERKSTADEKDSDMLVNFTVSFDPIDDASKEEIYVLEDNGDYYVSLDVLNRFNISSKNDLTYNDRLYYLISDSDYQNILSNKDNDYSPYDIVVETVSLNNNILDDDPISEVILPDAVEKKILDIYQSDDSDDCYILKSVCEDNNIPFNDVVVVDDLEYVLINSNNQKEFKEHFSDYDFVYHTIHIPSLSDSSEGKSAPVSSGAVIHELYHYLASPISKKPEACDIKVTRDFIYALQNAGDGFNIICSSGSNIEASDDLLSYLAKELFDTPRGKEVYDRFVGRVNSLSDEELAILTGSSDLENTPFQGVIGVRK